MIAREPERNGPWAGGMQAGLENPLGARALYLYQGNKDTMYRIHGTTEPWSIGQSVSSGCIRLFNQDIIDLHSRVPTGTTVVVLNRGTVAGAAAGRELRRDAAAERRAASEVERRLMPHRRPEK
jgi:hypothetical protein